MVKAHWKENADPKMIERAFRHLRIASECSLTMFSLRFHCNFPGIGNGGLPFEEVKDILERVKLPDNIILYKEPK